MRLGRPIIIGAAFDFGNNCDNYLFMPPPADKNPINLFSDFFLASNKIALNSGDDFLLETIDGNLKKLITGFISFYQNPQPAPSSGLIFRIENIVAAFLIFCHLKKIGMIEFLELEKKSLELKLSLMSFKGKIGEERTVSKNSDPENSTKKLSTKNGVRGQILDFIEGRGEVVNLEVFNRFDYFSRRTIKRHLSDLINSGFILRQATGKKVIYKTVSH